jgi:adenylate cyclase
MKRARSRRCGRFAGNSAIPKSPSIGRIVKTTGDGLLVEFASVVDAVRCAVEVQREMVARNAAALAERRIEFRMGINVGDIIIEDGDIFGDGVNIAARLEALAEPGGICLSAAAHEQVRDRLDLAFDDLGEQQVKNITRPVRTYAVALGASSRAALPAAAPLPLPDKPSLAVLPFQNMSGDPEQEYFADGMVEEITTAIARLPWLFVIARNSSFTYKGKPVDVKQVARELGVRYVLEGSVRKAANRVRITGQLIDATTGAHIWADRFDGALDDIFELQDQVASSVAGAIEPKLRQSEIERASRKPTVNLTAYDLYLPAMPRSCRYTEEGLAEAVVLARQALAIDPSYAPAAAMVGFCRGLQRMQGWGVLSDEDIGEACRLARRALEAERGNAGTIWQAAWTLFFLAGEAAMAAAALDRALAKHGSRLAGQREYPRAAQPARGGDRSHRTGAPFEPVRSVCLSLRLCYRCRSSRRAALRTSDRMGRPRLARPAPPSPSDVDQSRRVGASRPSRRGTHRTQPGAGDRSQPDHRRLSRVRSLYGTGNS